MVISTHLTSELIEATWQTIKMVVVSGVCAFVLGLPLGILLLTTREHGLFANRFWHRVLAAMVNALRSIPFIILLVAIIPLTRFVVGTSIGTEAAMVPLTLSAAPFIARVVENALSEVSHGLIEAGLAMGATPLQIIIKILLPEALVSIISGITLMFIALIGYAAMAGAIGGGGLGDFAIRYGYERFETNVMIMTIILLIALVQLVQYVGDYFAHKCNHR